MVGRRVPSSLSEDEMRIYINSVKQALQDEPAKYDEFIEVLNDLGNLSVNAATVIAKVEELLRNHRDLLLGFNAFVPDEAPERLAKSYNTKRNLFDAENFMNKLKTRFSRIDTHVVESFLKIMKRFNEGKISEKKAYDEVIDILYYHEDLINDFSRIFTNSDPVATSSLLLLV